MICHHLLPALYNKTTRISECLPHTMLFQIALSIITRTTCLSTFLFLFHLANSNSLSRFSLVLASSRNWVLIPTWDQCPPACFHFTWEHFCSSPCWPLVILFTCVFLIMPQFRCYQISRHQSCLLPLLAKKRLSRSNVRSKNFHF